MKLFLTLAILLSSSAFANQNSCQIADQISANGHKLVRVFFDQTCWENMSKRIQRENKMRNTCSMIAWYRNIESSIAFNQQQIAVLKSKGYHPVSTGYQFQLAVVGNAKVVSRDPTYVTSTEYALQNSTSGTPIWSNEVLTALAENFDSHDMAVHMLPNCSH